MLQNSEMNLSNCCEETQAEATGIDSYQDVLQWIDRARAACSSLLNFE